MTKEELTMMEREAWTHFQHNYPLLTDERFTYRVMRAIFGGKGITRLIWENAWLRGMNSGVDLVMPLLESAPQEPKSGQPGSHESHSSSHSQGGDFPDANPSK